MAQPKDNENLSDDIQDKLYYKELPLLYFSGYGGQAGRALP